MAYNWQSFLSLFQKKTRNMYIYIFPFGTKGKKLPFRLEKKKKIPKKIFWSNYIKKFQYYAMFNPKKTKGGGRNLPICQEIARHFSQDHTMFIKFLVFIHKHPI